MNPIPIAVKFPSGLVLRGHEWPQSGPPVLLVHDLGEDLDVWAPIPERLVDAGFRVVAAELRGHGLSDGTPDPATTVDDVRSFLRELGRIFGPAAIVGHGATGSAAFQLSGGDGAPVHVVISPRPGPAPVDRSSFAAAMRLIVSGSLHAATREYLQEVYPRLRGQNMWITAATADTGPRLLIDHPNLFEQVTIFLRRYLTPLNDAWKASHPPPDGAESSSPPDAPEA